MNEMLMEKIDKDNYLLFAIWFSNFDPGKQLILYSSVLDVFGVVKASRPSQAGFDYIVETGNEDLNKVMNDLDIDFDYVVGWL